MRLNKAIEIDPTIDLSIGTLVYFHFRHRDTGEDRAIWAGKLEHAQEHYPPHRGWEPIDPRAQKQKMKLVLSGGQVRKVPVES